MEGLGGTGAAGIERCFTTRELAVWVLCIPRFSLTDSVPDEGTLEQLVLGSFVSSGPLRG